MQNNPGNITPAASGAPLSSAEDIMQALLQSPVATGLLKGPEMEITVANQAFLDLWGISSASPGLRLGDILPAARKDLLDIFSKVFQTGIPYHNEITLSSSGNEPGQATAAYHFNCSPFRSEKGEITGVFISATRMRQHTGAESLHGDSSGHFYEELIASLPIAAYISDLQGRIIGYNPPAAELFGRQAPAGPGQWTMAWKTFGEEGSPVLPQHSQMALTLRQQQSPPEKELTVLRPDGSARIIVEHPHLLFDRTNKSVAGINLILDITGQKQAEKGAAYLAAIIHSTDDAIISKTLDGVITSWNPAAEKLFGYTEEEAVGSLVTRLFPPDRIKEEELIIDRIKKGERVEHFDTVRIKKNGQPLNISLTISPVKDNTGRIIGASKIARDITSRQQLYKALHESEQKFRELITQAPVGITILRGRDYICEMANRTYLEIVDRTQDQMIGKPLFESLPEVKESVQPLLDAIMDTGIPYHGNEFRVFLSRHGIRDTAYFNFVYQPLREPGGSISGIIVVANEVTEQVEAQHALAESEKEFRRMVMQSPIAMTILRGPDFVIEMANREMLNNIWKKEHSAVVGRKLLEAFPELQGQKFPELLKQVFRSGQPYRENESVAYVKWGDELRTFYLDFEYAPMLDTEGTAFGIMVTANDVTEKVMARQNVENAEARLRLAAEGTGLATWDLDLNTYEIIYTPLLPEIFGFPRDVVVGFTEIRSRIDPADVKNILSPAFRNAMETGIYYYEARVIWPDKSIHWIRTRGTVIFDEHQKPLRMLGTVQDSTEQKRASHILEESELRLNIALEAAEMGTWELNLITRHPTYSRRYLQILGFRDEDTPSHTDLLMRIHPEDLGKRDKAMAEAVKTGRLDIEMRILPSPKEIRWIRARGKLFYNKEGIAERMMGTLQDITEQKMAFNSLQESEERFKIVADSAPVMIWMSGSDRFLDFFNSTWLNFRGRTAEEERGEGWQNGVHPEDLPHCVEVYNRSFNRQVPFYIEYRLRRHDGEYRWISDNAVPRYNNGEFIGFISACMDIDDEKRFNQRLQQSELLFKTISNVSPVGLWMTDMNGGNTFVNQTWINWTGMKVDEQQEYGWLQSLLEADREVTIQQFRKKSAGREKFAAEFRFKRPDGQVRWAFSEGYPYYDSAGDFAGYAGSVTDITERKQDEIRKNEFLAVASHELKTPITSIKAYAQLLTATYQTSDDAFLKNAVIKIEAQVNKMTKLVGDFLNLSKIETDKIHFEKETFVLNELVEEAVSDIRLVSPGYEILFEKPAGPITVEADREKIMQVLANLLNNAVKYSPDDKLVVLRLTQSGSRAVIDIEDRGIGIRPEEYDRIFQRFYRSDPNNIRVSGFGIGLYISAEIIRRHEGTIGVRPNKDKGSCFYFELPVAEK